MDQFTMEHFRLYSQYIYSHFGIKIENNKRTLLFYKIDKALKNSNVKSYDEYYQLLVRDNKEIAIQFANIITTNTTEFFREISHFEFLRDNLNGIISKSHRIKQSGEIRIWSAGCSTGQEPYTIAMLMKELLGNTLEVKILATDISQKALNKAITGFYPEDIKKEIPKNLILKYFIKQPDGFQIKEEIKNLISYRTFNLAEEFYFQKGFDIIFCRNVMIYFDRKFQDELVQRFYSALIPGGLFFIGHSESLLNRDNSFHYVMPAIYSKSTKNGV